MGNELLIGDKLRQARLNKNISIDELQQKTKIQKRYLEAIEQGKFDLLPGEYYIRTFLRQYAAAVGENGDFLVAVFDEEAFFDEEHRFPKREIPEALQESRKGHATEARTWMNYLPMVALGLVALTILVIVFYAAYQDKLSDPVINSVEGSMQVEQSTEVTSETSTTETTTTSETQTSETQAEPTMEIVREESNANGVTFAIANAKTPRELRFTGTNGSCWVGVSINGEYVYQYTLQVDEEQTYTVPEDAQEVMIRVGASNNVAIALNDEKVDFEDTNYPALQKNIYLKFSEDETSETTTETTSETTSETTEVPQF